MLRRRMRTSTEWFDGRLCPAEVRTGLPRATRVGMPRANCQPTCEIRKRMSAPLAHDLQQTLIQETFDRTREEEHNVDELLNGIQRISEWCVRAGSETLVRTTASLHPPLLLHQNGHCCSARLASTILMLEHIVHKNSEV